MDEGHNCVFSLAYCSFTTVHIITFSRHYDAGRLVIVDNRTVKSPASWVHSRELVLNSKEWSRDMITWDGHVGW